VIKIDGHSFIFTEVESAGRAFYLKLAEAYPAPFSTKPVIVLQTKHQLQKQVLDFLNRPKDAARFAREQAQRAREIATEWKTIGAKMDTALDGVIANYKKLQETAVDLARTGHSAPPNMNHYVIKYLSHVLWNAGIDLTGGFPSRRGSLSGLLPWEVSRQFTLKLCRASPSAAEIMFGGCHFPQIEARTGYSHSP
jgi:hypothetical protein